MAAPGPSVSSLIRDNYLHWVSPVTMPRPSLQGAFRSALEKDEAGEEEERQSPRETGFSLGKAPHERKPLPELWRNGTSLFCGIDQPASQTNATKSAGENLEDGALDQTSGSAREGSLERVRDSSVLATGQTTGGTAPLSPSSSLKSLHMAEATWVPTTAQDVHYASLPPPNSGVAAAHDAVHYTEDDPAETNFVPRRYPVVPQPCGMPNCVSCLFRTPSYLQPAAEAHPDMSWTTTETSFQHQHQSDAPTPSVNVTVHLGDELVDAVKQLTEELAALKAVLSALPSDAAPASPVLQKSPRGDIDEAGLRRTSGRSQLTGQSEAPSAASDHSDSMVMPRQPCTPCRPLALHRAGSRVSLSAAQVTDDEVSPDAPYHSTPPASSTTAPTQRGTRTLGDVSAQELCSTFKPPALREAVSSESSVSYYSSSSDVDTTK